MKPTCTWALAVAAFALLGPSAACDSSSGGGTADYCDSPAPQESGKVAGVPCEKNEECQSNVCGTDKFASPTKKICIRSCSGVCPLPIECKTLDLEAEGVFYTCLPYKNDLGQQVRRCVISCTSDSDCTKAQLGYDACKNVGIGASKICVNSALSGGGADGSGSGGGDGSGGGGSDASGGDGGGVTPVNPGAGCYKTEDAPNPDGLLPGEPCQENGDCIHGLCTDTNPNVTGGKFKVCAKKCGGCPGYTPACPDDDGLSGWMFTCVKPTGSQGKLDHCAIRCDGASGVGGLDGCKTISPDYTSCNENNAGKKYCGGQ